MQKRERMYERTSMRRYAPAAVDAVLAHLLDDPEIERTVVAHRGTPPRDAVHAPLPEWLDPRLVEGLRSLGLERPYSHQAEAIERLRAGEDVTIVTPTASGKTLCYNLPVLQAAAEDAAARALLLFPTKALGQDQVAAFRELAAAAGLDIACATYDGDTP